MKGKVTRRSEDRNGPQWSIRRREAYQMIDPLGLLQLSYARSLAKARGEVIIGNSIDARRVHVEAVLIEHSLASYFEYDADTRSVELVKPRDAPALHLTQLDDLLCRAAGRNLQPCSSCKRLACSTRRDGQVWDGSLGNFEADTPWGAVDLVVIGVFGTVGDQDGRKIGALRYGRNVRWAVQQR